MGWDKGRYYTRSRKVNGRVVREYVGGGEIGRIAAEIDAINRMERQMEREELQAEMEALAEGDAPVSALSDSLDAMVEATLQQAGYHNHKGHWRKRRARIEHHEEA